MSCIGKFTENATGIEVVVEGVFAWAPEPENVILTYPDTGRRYSITCARFKRHFTMVSPQTIEMRAFGAVDERPLKVQQDADGVT